MDDTTAAGNDWTGGAGYFDSSNPSAIGAIVDPSAVASPSLLDTLWNDFSGFFTLPGSGLGVAPSLITDTQSLGTAASAVGSTIASGASTFANGAKDVGLWLIVLLALVAFVLVAVKV